MKKIAMRGAAVAAATGVALGTLTTGVASADTRLNFAPSSASAKIGDSTVTVGVKNHSALLSPGMVALPTTRNAWVTGSISVQIAGGKAKGGTIEAGYIVGCQVDITSANLGASGEASGEAGWSEKDGRAWAAGVKGKTGGSLSLKAGGIGYQYLTYDRATWPSAGDEVTPDWADPANDFAFSGSSGSLTYADQTIGVDGCAGYAQARFFAKAKVKSGNTSGSVTVWGKPFTLG